MRASSGSAARFRFRRYAIAVAATSSLSLCASSQHFPGSSLAGTDGAVAACDMAWQAVVRDRLPHRRGAHPRTDRRPDPWVAVERAHSHADPLRMLVVAREDGRAAVTAEPLLTPVLGVPASEDIVPGNDTERFNRSVGARRCRGTRSTLASTTVAVARAEQLGRHLVSHRTAVAASRQRKRRHASHCRGFATVSTTVLSSAAGGDAEVARSPARSLDPDDVVHLEAGRGLRASEGL